MVFDTSPTEMANDVINFADLSIQEGKTKSFVEVYQEFALTNTQLSKEAQLKTCETLARMAAKAIALGEDIILFEGTGGGLPANVEADLGSNQPITSKLINWPIGGKHSKASRKSNGKDGKGVSARIDKKDISEPQNQWCDTIAYSPQVSFQRRDRSFSAARQPMRPVRCRASRSTPPVVTWATDVSNSCRAREMRPWQTEERRVADLVLGWPAWALLHTRAGGTASLLPSRTECHTVTVFTAFAPTW